MTKYNYSASAEEAYGIRRTSGREGQVRKYNYASCVLVLGSERFSRYLCWVISIIVFLIATVYMAVMGWK